LINRYITHPDIHKYAFDHLHAIIYGASPIATDKLRQAIGIFGQIFIQNYGQSEVPLTIACLRKEDHIVDGRPEEVELLASVGRPYTMVDMKIAGEDGKEVAPVVQLQETDFARFAHRLALGIAGLALARFRHQYRPTGDVGKIKNGYVFLMDRKGEMIISGGLNIYPNEVEQAVYAHPAVLEACAFGVPDEKWQEAVTVAVVLKPGATATEAEIIYLCKERLASYKKPRSVVFLDSMPKNAQGKILRRELRAPYWKDYTRTIGG